jgi:hypothetical protein
MLTKNNLKWFYSYYHTYYLFHYSYNSAPGISTNMYVISGHNFLPLHILLHNIPSTDAYFDLQDIIMCMCMPIDGVWIGDWIY